MAVLTQTQTDLELLERVLRECARFYADPDDAPTITVFDREGGHYLLLNQGWDGYKRVHNVWVHLDVIDGNVWVQKDGTQDGIAAALVQVGIPRERIVLAFQHPSRRGYGASSALEARATN